MGRILQHIRSITSSEAYQKHITLNGEILRYKSLTGREIDLDAMASHMHISRTQLRNYLSGMASNISEYDRLIMYVSNISKAKRDIFKIPLRSFQMSEDNSSVSQLIFPSETITKSINLSQRFKSHNNSSTAQKFTTILQNSLRHNVNVTASLKSLSSYSQKHIKRGTDEEKKDRSISWQTKKFTISTSN